MTEKSILSPRLFWTFVLPSVFTITLVLALLGAFAVVKNREKPSDDGISIAGFKYDSEQDIFYSEINAWQREYGYCKLYDESAASFNMVIDCEPVIFKYGGKTWLIELWKGQYGMTGGGEIGIYASSRLMIPGDIPAEFWDSRYDYAFFDKISDDEMLPMEYTLYQNGEAVFNRDQTHWWLTGFKMGRYSPPDTLTMNARITIADDGMRNAFTAALKELGYKEPELKVEGADVFIIYGTPKSKQPSSRTAESDARILADMKKICDRYNEITDGVSGAEQKLLYLKKNNAELYKSAVSFARPRSAYFELGANDGEPQ